MVPECGTSATGAVIAGAYFPVGKHYFRVMIGTLFQQILAAFYGSMYAPDPDRTAGKGRRSYGVFSMN